ncbi:MAG: Fur family transcriptional regulator [Acidimicrobiales bacterium]
MAGDRLEAMVDLLRERRGRVTTPRRAIIAALIDAGSHVTAEELTATVRASHPDVAPSTVYRCLEALEEVGAVEHVHLGHGPAVYHVAGAGTHQHLVCESCGAVVEVPDALFEALARRVLTEFGFTLHPGHFAVGGRCRACSPPPG